MVVIERRTLLKTDMTSTESNQQLDEPKKKGTEAAPADEAIVLRLKPGRTIGRIFIVCVLIELALLVLDYHVNYRRWTDLSQIRHLFNNTREDGLASFLAVTQTVLIALTLWGIFICVRARRGLACWSTMGWLIMAVFFTYMAADDGAAVHERIGSAFKDIQEAAAEGQEATTLGGRMLEFFPSYPWQVVFLPVFGAMGLFILVFLWRELGDRLGRGLLVVALSCLALAIGLDFVEGLESDHPLNLYTVIANTFDLDNFTQQRFDRPPYTALRHFSKSIEEVTEMFAMTLLWVAFLRYLTTLGLELRLRGAEPSTDM